MDKFGMETKRTVKIITMCTNKYNDYLLEFVSTLDNFMPAWHKELYILSDIEPISLLQTSYDNITIRYEHIFHQYYLFLHMSKIDFITQCCVNDNSLFFYFDVDTKFIQKDISFWDNFYNMVDGEKYPHLIFEQHPSYIYHKGNNDLIQGESFANMKGASKFKYTPKSVYVCGAMFGGRINALNNFKLAYDKLRIQDYKEMYMGSWGDEHYLNRLINDTENIKLNMRITVGIFAYNGIVEKYFNMNEVFNTFPNIICEQKYNIDLKEKVKNLEN